MKNERDAFEAWIRDCARGCMEQEEIDELCKCEADFDGETYHFLNPIVQAQWDAWSAALDNKAKEIDAMLERYGGGPILPRPTAIELLK